MLRRPSTAARRVAVLLCTWAPLVMSCGSTSSNDPGSASGGANTALDGPSSNGGPSVTGPSSNSTGTGGSTPTSDGTGSGDATAAISAGGSTTSGSGGGASTDGASGGSGQAGSGGSEPGSKTLAETSTEYCNSFLTAEAIPVNAGAGEAPRPVIQADGTLYAATLDAVEEPAGYVGFLQVTISQPGTYWLMFFEDRELGIANLMGLQPLEGAQPAADFASCTECRLACDSESVISSYRVGAGNYEVYLRSDYGQLVYFAMLRGE